MEESRLMCAGDRTRLIDGRDSRQLSELHPYCALKSQCALTYHAVLCLLAGTATPGNRVKRWRLRAQRAHCKLYWGTFV